MMFFLMVRTMVEAIVTSAQPPQFFFLFFLCSFHRFGLVMCKEFRGNTLFFGIPEKKEDFLEIA